MDSACPDSSASATRAARRRSGERVLKLGTAVKKAASDKKASKDEALRLHEERALAAGRLVTSGIFGTSTIEIYEHGFVRVAPGGERYAEAEKITRKTPYERLRSITFGVPEAERAHDTEGPGSPIEGAVMQAMSGIVRGGKLLTKGTAVGIAATGWRTWHRTRPGSRTS